MKYTTTILAVLLLAGCAPIKSLEELKDEASVSGDWSEVERRERILKRRAERGTCQRGSSCETISCPAGQHPRIRNRPGLIEITCQ